MKQLAFYIIILSITFIVVGCKDTTDSAEKQPEATVQVPAAATAPQETVPKKVQEATPAFFEAALGGRLEFVESEVTAGVPVDAQDPTQKTALMLAAFNGHTNIVEMLITHGGNVNATDEMHRTALMFAASGPFSETVRLLLAKGADVNVIDNNEGWTALMFAAAEGQAENVRLLLDAGADTTAKDIDGDTAESFAAKAGHTAIATMIRDYTAVKQ